MKARNSAKPAQFAQTQFAPATACDLKKIGGQLELCAPRHPEYDAIAQLAFSRECPPTALASLTRTIGDVACSFPFELFPSNAANLRCWKHRAGKSRLKCGLIYARGKTLAAIVCPDSQCLGRSPQWAWPPARSRPSRNLLKRAFGPANKKAQSVPGLARACSRPADNLLSWCPPRLASRRSKRRELWPCVAEGLSPPDSPRRAPRWRTQPPPSCASSRTSARIRFPDCAAPRRRYKLSSAQDRPDMFLTLAGPMCATKWIPHNPPGGFTRTTRQSRCQIS